MKKFSAILTLCLLFTSFTIGCERASLNRIGKDVYYVQLKGEGRNLRNYTLHAYDEDGVKNKLHFEVQKRKRS